MNRIIKEAMVKRYHYDSHATKPRPTDRAPPKLQRRIQLRSPPQNPARPYALRIHCKCWENEPERFTANPHSKAGIKQLAFYCSLTTRRTTLQRPEGCNAGRRLLSILSRDQIRAYRPITAARSPAWHNRPSQQSVRSPFSPISMQAAPCIRFASPAHCFHSRAVNRLYRRSIHSSIANRPPPRAAR